jgi:uncharacterized HAD superfamily protein
MLVTFDFDSTLTTPKRDSFAWQDTSFWTTSSIPQQAVIDTMRELAEAGHDVMIVTTRSKRSRQGVEQFVEKHDLPVQEIHCTEGEDKLPVLENLGSQLHFDDDVEEMRRIQGSDVVHGKLVLHPHDRQHTDVSGLDIF